MNFRRNPILRTDSYKISHHSQYPNGTEHLYSYWESRGSKINGVDETLFFGLQPMLHLLETPVTMADVDEADAILAKHFNDTTIFNREGWEIIVNEYDGHLPIRIRAVPEGTLVPTGNVMMTVENLDSRLPWLTNYLETLLCQVWYPTTVATYSWHIKNIIRGHMERTCDSIDGLAFKLHDFGFRGVSSVESAEIGGAAHLVNFMGTDTLAALPWIIHFYGGDVAGFSIPAAEHSTVTSWGPSSEDEDKAFANMIEQFGDVGTGLYAVVSDSYDFFDACKRWATIHRPNVLSHPNMLVVRPDSGDPIECIVRGAQILDEEGFGHTVNSKGYKVLNNVRLIQGDGINHEDVDSILTALTEAGYSAENVAFGMGGSLLQKLNRDTFKFAFKASDITISGEHHPVFKKPVTDTGKNSKSGRLALITTAEGYETVAGPHPQDELRTVFVMGEVTRHQNFDDIRHRAAGVVLAGV